MGQASKELADIHDERRAVEMPSLDERIAAILGDIEKETVPARLLELATDLQQALILQRQQNRPN